MLQPHHEQGLSRCLAGICHVVNQAIDHSLIAEEVGITVEDVSGHLSAT
jgi:hypothetical protein